MAKSVFFSFHYDRDAWRVQQIRNMGVLEVQPLLNSQKWEEVKRQGDAAIQRWIADQMAYKSAVVVLVGAQTAQRPWVRYEIGKAWDDRKPLVGIRIHGLADGNGNTDSIGGNPFQQANLKRGGTVADYVPLHTPGGWNSKTVHADIRSNLSTWVASAYKRS